MKKQILLVVINISKNLFKSSKLAMLLFVRTPYLTPSSRWSLKSDGSLFFNNCTISLSNKYQIFFPKVWKKN